MLASFVASTKMRGSLPQTLAKWMSFRGIPCDAIPCDAISGYFSVL